MRAYLATLDFLNNQSSKRKELEQLFDTAPIRYREAIKYIKSLFESPTQNMVKMNKILEEQEKGINQTVIPCFQDIALQKYGICKDIFMIITFFQKNYLPLDYFPILKII